LAYDAVVHWGAFAQINEHDVLRQGIGLLPERPADQMKVAPELFSDLKQANYVSQMLAAETAQTATGAS